MTDIIDTLTDDEKNALARLGLAVFDRLVNHPDGYIYKTVYQEWLSECEDFGLIEFAEMEDDPFTWGAKREACSVTALGASIWYKAKDNVKK